MSATDEIYTNWKDTIEDTGYGPTKPYLWNYEIISYDNETTSQTKPALLGSRGKGIQTLNEYYQLTATAGAPAKPSKDSLGGWKTGSEASTQPTSALPYM